MHWQSEFSFGRVPVPSILVCKALDWAAWPCWCVNLPSLCQHWGFASLPALGLHRHAATLACLAKGCELFPWCSDTWSSLYELLSRVILIYYNFQWASFRMPGSTVDCLSPFDVEWFLNEEWCSKVPLWDPWVVSTYERRNRCKIRCGWHLYRW